MGKDKPEKSEHKHHRNHHHHSHSHSSKSRSDRSNKNDKVHDNNDRSNKNDKVHDNNDRSNKNDRIHDNNDRSNKNDKVHDNNDRSDKIREPDYNHKSSKDKRKSHRDHTSREAMESSYDRVSDKQRRDRNSLRTSPHSRYIESGKRDKHKSNRNSKYENHYRSRSRSPDTQKDERTTRDYKRSPSKEKELKLDNFKQETLEEEMKRRKERVEAWRVLRRADEPVPGGEATDSQQVKKPRKEWTLDDDEDDGTSSGEDNTSAYTDITNANVESVNDKTKNYIKEVQKTVLESDTDEDPLESYMLDINSEVSKMNTTVFQTDLSELTKTDHKEKDDGSFKKTLIISGEKKRVDTDNHKKGEVINNDMENFDFLDEETNEHVDNSLSILAAGANKKKELAKVDHNAVTYFPFRKDFYVEVPELTRMTDEEVNTYREDLENIIVKGKDCPKPVKRWNQCGISNKVADLLKKYDYAKPTPIQAQALPAIMSGRDMIGIAKTGSGKTLSFVLPLLRHVVAQPPLSQFDGPIALILSPTRELSLQIHDEIKKFSKHLKLTTICVYGGASISDQISELKRGAEIVVCTPGRMIELLGINNGKVTNLLRVTYVVLDEADRMFDLGFEPQVTKIINNIRPNRQTVMFSATFPRSMEILARKILIKPLHIEVGARSVVCKDVTQEVAVLEDEDQKYHKLLELLGLYLDSGSCLVFVEKQEQADNLLKELLKSGYPCLTLHGGMDQHDRACSILDFKQQNARILVATSVGARGLDVRHIYLVVNFSCPNHYEDYVHRCGRTGRAGAKGLAYTFLTETEAKLSGVLIRAFNVSEREIPQSLQLLYDSYCEKLKSEGKKVPSLHKTSGFIDRWVSGYKFDANEDAKKDEMRRVQKAIHGVDSDDEELDTALDQYVKKLENAFKASTPRIREADNPVIPLAGPQVAKVGEKSEGLRKAEMIALRLNQAKKLEATTVTDIHRKASTDLLAGGSIKTEVSGRDLASHIAAGINMRIGAGAANQSQTILPPGTKLGGSDNRDDSQNKLNAIYEDEVEINDFPQQARFRITHRDTLDQITEYTEVGITVRGVYIPENSKPKGDEKRLFLAMEATSEHSIEMAKAEVKQILKEELQKIAARPVPKSGRYTVI